MARISRFSRRAGFKQAGFIVATALTLVVCAFARPQAAVASDAAVAAPDATVVAEDAATSVFSPCSVSTGASPFLGTSPFLDITSVFAPRDISSPGATPFSCMSNSALSLSVSDAFGITRKQLIDYLLSHEGDGYYLGTPYPKGYPFEESYCVYPSGAPRGDGYTGLNCAGFVAHVFQSLGANLQPIADQGADQGAIAASNWANWAMEIGATIYRYPSISALLADGRCVKGDLLYFNPTSYDEPSADTHIGFFWGDYPSDDRFWHSVEGGNRISNIMGQSSTYTIFLIKLSDEGFDEYYAPIYDYDYYLSEYADVDAAFNGDKVGALKHFVTTGMSEGRIASSWFDVDYYRANNPDLEAAYGDDLKSYYLHFLRQGQAEGRLGCDPASLVDAQCTVEGAVRDWTGTPLTPTITVTKQGVALTAGADYQVLYDAVDDPDDAPVPDPPTAAGSYNITIEACGSYAGTKGVGTFSIYDVSSLVDPGIPYHVRSAADPSFVLDAAGVIPQTGSNVSVWTVNGGANQVFCFEPDGEGFYMLRSAADSSLVLDAAGQQLYRGCNVSMWTSNGGANQKWALVPQGDGTFCVASAYDGELVLDAAGTVPQVGANVSVWTSNGGTNQRWTLEDASSLAGASVALSGNIRDYDAASTFADVEPAVSAAFGAAGTLAEGTDFRVSFRGADGTAYSASDAAPAAGEYDVVLTGMGTYHGEKVAGTLVLHDASSAVVPGRSYRIRSAASSSSDPYVLDVAGNVPRLGANVSIWTDNGGANQCFTFELGTDGYYTVRNLARPDFVLDAAGYPPAPGANVSTWSENGFGNQRWVLVPGTDASGTPDGTWTIATAYDASLVLDAAGAQPSIGANVSAWTYNGGANQRWLLEDGGVDLAGEAASVAATGMVRDATGSALAPTVTVACNGRTLSEGTDYALSYAGKTSAGAAYGPTSQAPSAAGSYDVSAVGTGSTASGFHGSRTVGTFVVRDVSGAVSSGSVYRIRSASDPSFVLDVAGASPVLGSNVSIWTSNGGANQCFTFEPDGDGYYVLRNVANASLVLDAAGAQPVIGANVSTWTSNGGMNQRWVVVPGTDASGTPDGTYAIASACDPSLVLDAAGAQPTIGANVSVWTSNKGANQRWTLEMVDPATLGAATTEAPTTGSGSAAIDDGSSTTGSGSVAIGDGSSTTGGNSGSVVAPTPGSGSGSVTGPVTGGDSGSAAAGGSDGGIRKILSCAKNDATMGA